MTDELDPETLMAVLGDEYARAILAAASREPQSVRAMSEEIGASKATVYRRVDTLLDHGFLVEYTQTNSNGAHFTVYEANLAQVRLGLADGRYEVSIRTEDDVPDGLIGRLARRLDRSSEYLRRISGD